MHTRLTVLPTPDPESDAASADRLREVLDSIVLEAAPVPGASPAGEEPRYWICALGPGRLAHALPAWGLWMDGAVVFSTDTESVADGDPRSFPATIAQADRDGVKLLDGTATRVHDAVTLGRFAVQCEAKYGFEFDPHDPDTPVYALTAT
jgi:hypothetical protein